MTQLNSTSTVRALLLPLLLGTLTAHAAASDLHVDDDGMDYPNADYTSIQDAVDAGGGTIYVHAGTYTGTGSEVVMINRTVDLIADTTYGDVVIDGQNWRRCLTVLGRDADTSTYSINVEGFTIVNGRARFGQAPNSEHGGGIYAEGEVNIYRCEISSCYSEGNGGGIAVFNPNLYNNTTTSNGYDSYPYTHVRIFGGSVDNCIADGDGGGIWNWESNLDTVDSKIHLNGAYGRGGGIAAHHWCVHNGLTVLWGTTEVWGNTAEGDGGGVFAEGNEGHVFFREVDIVSNRSLTGDGGGICLLNADAIFRTLTLTQNDADQVNAGGSGGNGGGLAARSSIIRPDGNTGFPNTLLFLENTADCSGGGLFAKNSDVELEAAQFEGNMTIGKGGGMAVISCTDFDLDQVTFLENIGRVAGGLYLKNTYGTLTDSSVLYNKGFMNGGMNGAGITIDGGSAELVISGTNFWQNTKKHIMKGNGGKFTDGGGNSVQP
jgi:predicted outer membrane repeat protein